MTTPTDYPLFIPPPPLYEKSHFDWTLAEARAYQAWMLGQLSPRTEALWALLGEDQADPPAAWTERVGRELARLVVQAPFSEGGRLTNQGYALGADAGLLIARALLANHPAVRWEIVRKPKRDMSFHLPVLVGMGPVYLDPIGGTISELNGVLEGLRGPSFLGDLYRFWSARAGPAGATPGKPG